MVNTIQEQQREICNRLGIKYLPTGLDAVIGVSKGVFNDLLPVNGLRHPQTNESSGWYIWAGEYSDDEQFFEPMHAKHLFERKPYLTKYLGLPPGWRFQVDGNGYEDVWEDTSLLEV